MRSRVAAGWAGLLFLFFLAGCTAQYQAPPTALSNPILIREFAVSPAIVTLDPSFGFSLYRGERGVPREHLSVSGYWRRGRDEDGWQADKRSEREAERAAAASS